MTTETELMTREQLLAQPWAQECELTLHDGSVTSHLMASIGLSANGQKVKAIAIRFNSIVNWYAITGASCPVDGTEWKWEYGDLPGITTWASMQGRTDPLNPQGFTLIVSQHRAFAMKCAGTCGETYLLHNND